MHTATDPLKQSFVPFGFAVVVTSAIAQMTNVIFEADFNAGVGEGNFNNSTDYCVAGSSSGGSLAQVPSDVTGCHFVQN